MNHNVSTMFQRLNQNRCKSIVNNKNQIVVVCNFSNAFNIQNVRIWIAESFTVDNFCIWFDCFFNCLQIRKVNNCVFNSLSRKRMRNKIVSSAVKIVGCNQMVSVLKNILKRIRNSGCTRSNGKTRNSTF